MYGTKWKWRHRYALHIMKNVFTFNGADHDDDAGDVYDDGEDSWAQARQCRWGVHYWAFHTLTHYCIMLLQYFHTLTHFCFVLLQYFHTLTHYCTVLLQYFHTLTHFCRSVHCVLFIQYFHLKHSFLDITLCCPRDVPQASPLGHLSGNLFVIGDIQPNTSLLSAVYVYVYIQYTLTCF